MPPIPFAAGPYTQHGVCTRLHMEIHMYVTANTLHVKSIQLVLHLLGKVKSLVKDKISVTKALHFPFLLPLSPPKAACPKFLYSFRSQEGVNVCKGSLETGQSSSVVKLCCCDMKRQKAKLHWEGKCQQNNKLNAVSVSKPLLLSVPHWDTVPVPLFYLTFLQRNWTVSSF